MSLNLLRPTGSQLGGRVWRVECGYDLVAEDYDQWYWQAFWRAQENKAQYARVFIGVSELAGQYDGYVWDWRC